MKRKEPQNRAEVVRNADGTIAKGSGSLNAGGRPSTDREWKAWCSTFEANNRKHIEARALANDDFLRFIIEQAHGKAKQQVDHTSNGETLTVIDPNATATELRKYADEIETNLKFAEGRESILQ